MGDPIAEGISQGIRVGIRRPYMGGDPIARTLYIRIPIDKEDHIPYKAVRTHIKRSYGTPPSIRRYPSTHNKRTSCPYPDIRVPNTK